jgi:hypothetical protein
MKALSHEADVRSLKDDRWGSCSRRMLAGPYDILFDRLRA